MLASGVEEKPWTDDILARGREIQEKAIALEKDILDIVNTKM